MEKILYGICVGLKKEELNDDIKKISTKALQDCVGMIENFLSQKEIREYVLTLVLENLGNPN